MIYISMITTLFAIYYRAIECLIIATKNEGAVIQYYLLIFFKNYIVYRFFLDNYHQSLHLSSNIMFLHKLNTTLKNAPLDLCHLQIL